MYSNWKDWVIMATDFGKMHIQAGNVQSLHASVVANDMDNLQKLLFTNRVDVNAIDQNGFTAMYRAVSLKNLDAIKLLVLAGADVNTEVEMNYCIYTALYLAVKAGDSVLVKFFVGRGANVNARCGWESETPLLLAAKSEKGQYDIIEVLVMAGAAVNVWDCQGLRPLHVLAHRADNETVSLLLNYNACPDVTDICGNVPLYYAISEKNVAVLDSLINVTASPNTSLHAAAIYNEGESNFFLIQKLLNNGYDPNFQDSYGNTPLHYLVQKPINVDIIRLFLRFEADLGIINFQGETLLTRSLRSGDLEMIRFLIDQNCDLEANSHDKSTILHILARRDINDEYFELAKMALENGADVNAQDSKGNTPLHHLVHRGGVKTVQLFLDYKANVNAVNHYEKTPLFSALFDICSLESNSNFLQHRKKSTNVKDAKKDRYEVIQLLLRNGASVNFQGFLKKTPFHCALRESGVEVAKLFLDFKADVDLQDSSGEIPLFSAIRSDNVDIVQLLIDHGSNVNSITKNGLTPLHLACVRLNLDVIKCLLRNGGDINAIDFQRRTPLMAMILESQPHQAVLEFVLKYTDFNTRDSQLRNVCTFQKKYSSRVSKIVLEHLAKLKSLDLALDPSILDAISNQEESSVYFKKCLKELELAKDTRFEYCWVSFFNLLVDNKKKLNNYAGNSDLTENFRSSDCLKKFMIYGATIPSLIQDIEAFIKNMH